MSNDLPTVITEAGLQPQTPAALRAELVGNVAATNPGYTANLPFSMVEDIASTDVGALSLIDSARVETVNSLTPYGCNAFVLNQLGQQAGVMLNEATNTSVSVVFSGPPGFVVAQGFVVGDGVYQYQALDGGVIGDSGDSPALFCVSTTSGSWTIAPGTVTQIVTSVPSTVSPPITCSNPLAGTPGGPAETETSYRSRVLQAGLAASQGMASFLRTLLGEVSGVQSRLIAVRQQAGGGWSVICGGGDPFEVANAIFTALFDVSTLVGSTLGVTAITKAANGQVTTDLNHNLSNGSIVRALGVVGMTGINSLPLTVTVTGEKSFTTGVDTSGFGSYVSGGVITPNPRNVAVTLQDYPDVYLVTFVDPPQQTVTIAVTWNTSTPNFVSQSAVSQLGAPALAAYVNSITVGNPINLFELQTVFQAAIATIVPPALLTRMLFSVSINGISTPPDSGTGVIAGDPESYFETTAAGIVVTQG